LILAGLSRTSGMESPKRTQPHTEPDASGTTDDTSQESNRIILGHCLTALRTLPAESVDGIISDGAGSHP
jgi:hypothetical protein